MPISEAQKKAKKKWEEKNKEKSRINSYKRSARTYIKNHAEESDIKELRELLSDREKTLQKD